MSLLTAAERIRGISDEVVIHLRSGTAVHVAYFLQAHGLRQESLRVDTHQADEPCSFIFGFFNGPEFGCRSALLIRSPVVS
ncbi:hypothetical protein [Ensifer adhaerens]|uniref:hypothetical protein n=1 Tax=Ensifer adhaerens TaxID=106592 RepID=UPI00128F90FC|nr:hypothetical protein [Ensifer adhaerens]